MRSIFQIFHKGLQKTATSLSRSLGGLFSGIKHWDDSTFERLEAALIGADFGVDVSLKIVADIRDRYTRGLISTGDDILAIARDDVTAILSDSTRQLDLSKDPLTVVLLVGVNGSGKTTTGGKLAHMLKADGKKVMMAACDTFRAAAAQQLKLWGERVGCPVVSSAHGSDPSAVAFDAVKSAQTKGCDVLIIDTAGRQHTKKGLMDELAKMTRTIGKIHPGAPQEVWLVVDASVGSNALSQARQFASVSGVNGLVLTKLDGTGKGGMVVAIKQELNLPVFFVGLGEAPDDLQPFDPKMYAQALFEVDGAYESFRPGAPTFR